MKKFFQQGLIMAAGVFALPATMSQADQSPNSNECRTDDPRLACLRRFFHRANCPLENMAAVFIKEADLHHLDWRLLPGLSFVESGGGRAYRGNNVFGWNNGNSSFKTVREGIHVVASRLAYSPYYKGKGLMDKLKTYNTDENYPDIVRGVMQQISAVE